MPKDTEKIGIHKIVTYPKEVYCLHYKGMPFSLSNISYEEQRSLGIHYPTLGTISRKVYFTKGNAQSGIKHLPEFLRDKVEIVKYVPENQQKLCILGEEFKNDTV